MKIAIFGAGGQLGRALQGTLPEGWELLGLTHADLDIADPGAVDRIVETERADIVINAAAYNAVDAAEDDAETAFLVNGEAPGHMARSCAKHGVRFIHLSTDYVFDGTSDAPIAPHAATNPISVYGRSKRAGEEAGLAHLDALIVRTSWLYGGHGHNFLTTMLRLMDERDELGIVADQTGVPTHTQSLAHGIWALVNVKAAGIHHFTDNGVTTWHGFASAIEEKARSAGLIDGCAVRPIATEQYPTPAARPRYSVLDCTDTWTITGEPRAWEEELDIALDIWKASQ